MPCDTRQRNEMEKRRREEALKALTARLKNGSARMVRVGNRIEIQGWGTDRQDWCDECAVNALKTHADFTIRQLAQRIVSGVGQLVFGHQHTHGDGTTHTH